MHSKTRIIFIASAIFSAAAVVVFGYFLFQTVNAGHMLTQRVDAIAQMNATLKTNTELSSLIGQTQEERIELAKLILTEARTSQFLTEIEAIASHVGVSLTTRSLKVVEQKEGSYDLLQLELQIHGRDDLVSRMLQLLEKLPYHNTMERLHVSKDSGTAAQAEVMLSITLQK